MRIPILFALCLLPFAASATKLDNCDDKSYEVNIINGGEKHVETLSPHGGSIQEFGPKVSMQIAGHDPVVITEPHDEYCIWKGKITLQRRDNDDGGGAFGQR